MCIKILLKNRSCFCTNFKTLFWESVNVYSASEKPMARCVQLAKFSLFLRKKTYAVGTKPNAVMDKYKNK